jgi:hypothetical protein
VLHETCEHGEKEGGLKRKKRSKKERKIGIKKKEKIPQGAPPTFAKEPP